MHLDKWCGMNRICIFINLNFLTFFFLNTEIIFIKTILFRRKTKPMLATAAIKKAINPNSDIVQNVAVVFLSFIIGFTLLYLYLYF